jgi:hypothetical protein
MAPLHRLTSKDTNPVRRRGVAAALATMALLAAPPLHAKAPSFGMVPHRSGIDRAVTPTCANPSLSYFGGPILQNPTVIAVFWNANVNATLQANIGQFYGDVMASSYWSWLHEYDTVGRASNQAILSGIFGGSFVVQPVQCPASTTTSCNLTDAQLQSELTRQIDLGVLPAPTLDCTGNADTVYMVDFPPNVRLAGPGGIGTSCVQFCAYHNTGLYGAARVPLVYGALMDVFTGGCAQGCGTNPTALANSTSVASHELVEAVTDPDVGLVSGAVFAAPAAWGSDACGEIADICEVGVGDTISVNGRSWTVQELWSNQQGKCTSTGPTQPVCTGTTLTGCRRCSCGDTGRACGGATPACETTSTNALYGACEACTASHACAAGQTCQQSGNTALDDVCLAPSRRVPALGNRTPILAALLVLAGLLAASARKRRADPAS